MISALQPGSRVADGEYELLAPLGEGGFGAVWKARNLALDTTVALKFFRREGSQSKVDTLVQEEGRRMAALRTSSSPGARHIVTVYRSVVNRAEHWPFLEMELLEGGSLRQYLDRQGRLDLPEVHALARQMALAIRCAHERNLLHRDIKPDNILLGPARHLFKLGDFGLAARFSEANLSGGGTPKYMSPEQFSGHNLTTATDLYSLGIVLYECIAGRAPFVVDSQLDRRSAWESYAQQHAQAMPAPLLNVQFESPAGQAMIALIGRCLEKTPASRLSLEELLHGLQRIDLGESLALTAPKFERLRRVQQTDRYGNAYWTVRHLNTRLGFEQVDSGHHRRERWWWPTDLIKQVDFLRFIRDPDSPHGQRWSPQLLSPASHDGGYLADWSYGQPPRQNEHDPLHSIPYAAALDYCQWLGAELPTVELLSQVVRDGLPLAILAALREYQKQRDLDYVLLWCRDTGLGETDDRPVFRYGVRDPLLGSALLRVKRAHYYCLPHLLFVPVLPDATAAVVPEESAASAAGGPMPEPMATQPAGRGQWEAAAQLDVTQPPAPAPRR